MKWPWKQRESAEPLSLRDILFADMKIEGLATCVPDSGWASDLCKLREGHPEAAIARWQELTVSADESRDALQAWACLREKGVLPPAHIAKQVLGVVVEVRMRAGLDLLAAYRDHRARYYNYSGAGVVWERADSPPDGINATIDRLLAASAEVVSAIGPWKGERPGELPEGHVRLNFLTPSGLHFGEGPHNALAADPLAASVLSVATHLMIQLTTFNRG
jgi:hypothetical protein